MKKIERGIIKKRKKVQQLETVTAFLRFCYAHSDDKKFLLGLAELADNFVKRDED